MRVNNQYGDEYSRSNRSWHIVSISLTVMNIGVRRDTNCTILVTEHVSMNQNMHGGWRSPKGKMRAIYCESTSRLSGCNFQTYN